MMHENISKIFSIVEEYNQNLYTYHDIDYILSDPQISYTRDHVSLHCKKNGHLFSIDVGETYEHLTRILPLISRVTLKLINCDVNPKMFTYIASLKNIRTLVIDEGIDLTSKVDYSLLVNIKELEINDDWIGEENIQQIFSLTNIKKLYLNIQLKKSYYNLFNKCTVSWIGISDINHNNTEITRDSEMEILSNKNVTHFESSKYGNNWYHMSKDKHLVYLICKFLKEDDFLYVMNKNNNIYYIETNNENSETFFLLPVSERISYYDLSVSESENHNKSVMYIRSANQYLKHHIDCKGEKILKKYDIQKNVLWYQHEEELLKNITKNIKLRNIIKRRTKKCFFS
jgi:hypothetical protein